MVKGPQFRIMERDKEFIRKLHSRISSKKSRLKTQHHVLAEFDTQALPTFASRQEFNRYKREAEKFLAQSFTEEKKFATTKEGKNLFARSLVEQEINRINNMLTKEKNKRGISDEEVEYRKMMGNRKLKRFEPYTFNPDRYKTEKGWMGFLEKLQTQYEGNFIKKEDIVYKDKYLKSLHTAFGNVPELQDKLNKVTNKIDRMSVDRFMNFYYNKEFIDLDHNYSIADAELKLNRIMVEWEIK